MCLRKWKLSVSGLSVYVAASLLPTLPVHAQQAPPAPPKSPQAAPAVPPTLINQTMMGLAQSLNPLSPQTKMLLRRADVQRELGLNPRQLEQMNPVLADVDQQLTRHVTTSISGDADTLRQLTEVAQNAQKSAGPGAAAGNGSSVTVVDENGEHTYTGNVIVLDATGARAGTGANVNISPEALQNIIAKASEAAGVFYQQQQKKIDAVLTAPQQKRLRELELQWRGPFALLNKPIGDRLPLPAEEHNKLDTAFSHYKTTLKDIDQSFVPLTKPLIQPNTDMRQNPAYMSLINRERKTIRKARLQAETDTLALLPIPAQQQWRVLTGKPFQFRPHDEATDTDVPREP